MNLITAAPAASSLRTAGRALRLVPERWPAALVFVVASAVLAVASVGVHGNVQAALIGAAMLAAGLGLAVLSWRLSVFGLLVYLPYSGIPILATFPHTQLANVAKDLLFVIPAYAGFLLSERHLSRLFRGSAMAVLAAFVAVVLLECLNPAVPTRLVSVFGLKVWLLYIPMLFLARRLLDTRGQLEWLFRLMLLVAVVPVAVGISIAVLADFLGWGVHAFDIYGGAAYTATQRFAHFLYGGGELWRVPSTFSFVTQYFGFTAAMVTVAFAWSRLSGRRVLGGLAIGIALFASLLTGERAAFVMTTALILLTVLLDGRAHIIGYVGAALAVAVTAALLLVGAHPGGFVGTILGIGLVEVRQTMVDGFWQTLSTSWLGHGTGTATGASRFAFPPGHRLPEFYLEAWWLKTVYELGLPGLLAAVGFFALLLRQGWQVVRIVPDRELRATGVALLTFIGWNLAFNVKGALMDFDPINVYFWLFAGLTLSTGRLAGIAGHSDEADEDAGRTAWWRLEQLRDYLGRSAFVRSLQVTVLVSVAIQVLNLVSGVVLARGLGPAGRGDVAVAMLWPTLIVGLGGLGIAEAVTYFTGSNARRNEHALATALWLGLAQSALLVAAGYLLLPLLLGGSHREQLRLSQIYLWVIPLFPLTLYPLAVLQGRLLIWRFNVSRVSVHLAYSVLLVALLAAHRVTAELALIASLAATFINFVLTFALIPDLRRQAWGFTGGVARDLVGYGWKVQLGNIATVVVQRADIFALTILATSVELGQYVVATAIGAGASLIPSAVSMVLFPVFSSQSEHNRSRAVARFLLVGGGITLLAIPVLGVLLPLVTPYLFGRAFAAAAGPARLLVAAYILRGLNQMLTAIVRGSGSPFRASSGEVVGLVVMLGLLVLLVPHGAIMGASEAVLMGAIVASVWMLMQVLAVTRLTMPALTAYWRHDLSRVRSLVAPPGALD